MKQILSILVFFICNICVSAQTRLITVENPYNKPVERHPVIVKITDADVKSATVTYQGKMISSQLDDLDCDGIYDELFFQTDLKRGEKKSFEVEYHHTKKPSNEPSQVYVEMMLTNSKVKSTNKQDLYISHLTVEKGVNPYWMLHHHGVAFENDMVAYRIYFDHRQTIDIYGKYHRGLELKATQFYPDDEQKTAGYGDDVLWVGSTLGLGTLRGWDGTKPVMLENVEHRSQRIIARGPLRTIVEVRDEGWTPCTGVQPVNMTQRFTLMAGHRECRVDVSIEGPTEGLLLSTGIINVKNSVEYTDHKGLRGCWGTDWPVSAKDSVGHKRETVGLGIYVQHEQIQSEESANKDNYAFVLKASPRFTYYVTFCSDNEDFGFHSAEEWFAYLKKWEKSIHP